MRYYRQDCIGKVLAKINDANLKTFVSEAAILGQLSHYNVVRLIGVCLHHENLAILLVSQIEEALIQRCHL